MNTKFETLLVERVEDNLIVSINRPSKLNALNSQVIDELTSLLTDLQNPVHKIKGMVVTGEGEKAFIAGADISEMANMSSSEAEEFAKKGQRVTTLFESLPFPVIAAVNGFALGGGCEMAMACDFIYATSTAVFGQPEVKLGLIPGFGGTQRLSKYIGRNRARYLVYSGKNLDAQTAENYGLVVELFGFKEQMMEEALKTLSKMGSNSPNAIRVCKKVMNEGNDLTVEEGLNIESKNFGEVFDSKDMKEGTSAFVEKRAPQFIGE